MPDKTVVLPAGVEVVHVPPPVRSLHRKLAEVMAEVERIPKRGKAPAAMGGFAFVQVGDAADVIRKALADRHVSMLPSAIDITGESEHETRSGGTMTTQTVRTTWTLTDGESGETAVIQSLGTGADSGDKYSPKAQTNAMKYALLMGFLLSTGDDAELSDSSDRQSRRTALAEREPEPDGPVTLTGVSSAGKSAPVDLLYRQGPPEQGPTLGFVVVDKDRGWRTQVVAVGDLATALWDSIAHEGARLHNVEVTVTGVIEKVAWKKDGKAMPAYRRMTLERIATPEFTLPVDEAESVPMGLVEDDLSDLPDELPLPEPVA